MPPVSSSERGPLICMCASVHDQLLTNVPTPAQVCSESALLDARQALSMHSCSLHRAHNISSHAPAALQAHLCKRRGETLGQPMPAGSSSQEACGHTGAVSLGHSFHERLAPAAGGGQPVLLACTAWLQKGVLYEGCSCQRSAPGHACQMPPQLRQASSCQVQA